jgi:hypothetical protein
VWEPIGAEERGGKICEGAEGSELGSELRGRRKGKLKSTQKPDLMLLYKAYG